MTSTTQLARNAETTRRQMAASLTELRARLSPRNLQDEAVRAISNSGPARFATGLRDDAANSAVPIAMLASGMLWAIANKRPASGSRPAPGSMDSLVSAGDMVIGAASSLARAVSAGVTKAQATGEAVARSAQRGGKAAARSAEAASDNGRALGSHVAAGVASFVRAARSNGSAATQAASDLTSRASRIASTGGKLASKDPVFIAGVGIAAAGIAAAIFGVSRQRDIAAAAGELIANAGHEAATVPVLSPEQVAGLGTETAPRAQGYGRDTTGAEEGVEAATAR
jgi:hypothetical protein